MTSKNAVFSTQSSLTGQPRERRSELGLLAFKCSGKTFKHTVTSALLIIIPNRETNKSKKDMHFCYLQYVPMTL